MTVKEKPNLRFVKLAPKQIVDSFPSQLKKDSNDNPVMLSRILLPSEEFSKNPIGNYATIVVPSWTIMDDKFYKDGDLKKYRILNINLDKTYEVQFNTNEKDSAGYFIKEKIIVQGDRLIEAFEKPEKKRGLEKKDNDIDGPVSKQTKKNEKELSR